MDFCGEVLVFWNEEALKVDLRSFFFRDDCKWLRYSFDQDSIENNRLGVDSMQQRAVHTEDQDHDVRYIYLNTNIPLNIGGLMNRFKGRPLAYYYF